MKYVIALGLSLFVLAFLVPNHYQPWLMFYNNFVAFVGVFVLFFIVFFKCPEKNKIPVFFVVCCLVAAIPIFQWMVGRIPFLGDAVLAFCFVLGFGCSYWIGMSGQYSYGERFVNVFLGGLVVASVLSVFFAMVQWLDVYSSVWVADLNAGARPYANLRQPNNLATLLCMGWMAVFYFFEKRLINQVLMCFLTVFLFLGLVLTESRTAMLGSLCLLVWWAWQGRQVCQRLCLAWLVVTVAGLWCGWFLLPHFDQWYWMNDIAQASRISSGGTTRIDIWLNFIEIIKHSPVVGYGWLQVGAADYLNVTGFSTGRLTSSAHNIVLDLILWNGVPLGIIIFGLFVLWGGRHLICQEGGQWCMLACAGFLLLHALLELPLEYAFFLFPFGVLCGICDQSRGGVRSFYFPGYKVLICSVIVLFALFLVIVFSDYKKVEKDILDLRFREAGYSGAGENKDLDLQLLSQLEVYANSFRVEVFSGMDEGAVDQLRAAAYRYPYPGPLRRYYLALKLNGMHEELAIELRRMNSLYGEGARRNIMKYLESSGSKY